MSKARSRLEILALLPNDERAIRETRRAKMALQTARLSTIKTLDTFDFSFQPSLDRNRALELARLGFIEQREVVHFLGTPSAGKTHLALALGLEPVKVGISAFSLPWENWFQARMGQMYFRAQSGMPNRPLLSTRILNRRNSNRSDIHPS